MALSKIIHHQHHLLQHMGIVSWVERATPSLNHDYSIWRDQVAEQESISPAASPTPISHITQSLQQLTEKLQAKPVPERTVPADNQSNSQQDNKTPDHVSQDVALADIPLHITACVGQYCVLLADLQHATEPEQQLWHNIRQAIQQLQQKHGFAPIYDDELTWFYAMLSEASPAQHQQNLPYFVQGYLQQIAPQHKIFVLGDIAHLPAQLERQQFASLKQMHHQVDLKRELWQAILALYS
ncbi:MAG: hypothetical protein Q4D05_04630 [Acinetobacter sp.]|nr:hypothetical protein [Acinetobacter sp.]